MTVLILTAVTTLTGFIVGTIRGRQMTLKLCRFWQPGVKNVVFPGYFWRDALITGLQAAAAGNVFGLVIGFSLGLPIK